MKRISLFAVLVLFVSNFLFAQSEPSYRYKDYNGWSGPIHNGNFPAEGGILPPWFYTPEEATKNFFLEKDWLSSPFAFEDNSRSRFSLRFTLKSPQSGLHSFFFFKSLEEIKLDGGLKVDVLLDADGSDVSMPWNGAIGFVVKKGDQYRISRGQSLFLNQGWQRVVFDWLNAHPYSDNSITSANFFILYVFGGPNGADINIRYRVDNFMARADTSSPWILINNMGEDVVTAVERVSNNIPESFKLFQNYPNPFNPSTVIKFALPEHAFVNLKVFNVLGQEVAALVKGEFEAGNYQVRFDAAGLPSGTYFYRFEAGKTVITQKMILSK